MNIRRAKPEDAAALARVHVAAWQAGYAGIVPESQLRQFTVEKREAVLGRTLTADEWETARREVMGQVRGTVQADILKEDQAQNSCIFSTEFALRMMGDIQEYFTREKVRNFYSASISGYHIAEAGANPITQAAFTLANGFTYV